MSAVTQRRRPTASAIAAAFAVCGLVLFACANSESVVNLGSGVLVVDDGGTLTFQAPDAPPIVAVVYQCASSECAARYTTCPDSTFPCDVDFANDSKHCGACDVVCPQGTAGASSWTTKCAGGKCLILCAEHFADCNGKVEDGCEKAVLSDPTNCGSCGNVCAAGVNCINGKCGCATGQTECDGTCVDLQKNDDHCGTCTTKCTAPDGGAPPPNHMYFGCDAGQCGKLKCVQDNGSTPLILWTDCNNNQADGCEVNVASDDANCVTCGVACEPGQKCSTILQHYPPYPACACPGGQTLCHGPIEGVANCVNIENDHENCGACGVTCASVEACIDAQCVLTCPAGTADCNGDHTDGFNLDGCETNTDVDPLHCGGCTIACDGTIGQPCQAGKCATKDCPFADGGVAR